MKNKKIPKFELIFWIIIYSSLSICGIIYFFYENTSFIPLGFMPIITFSGFLIAHYVGGADIHLTAINIKEYVIQNLSFFLIFISALLLLNNKYQYLNIIVFVLMMMVMIYTTKKILIIYAKKNKM